jgi:ABC-type antimicrobial peptide transport system permease subunit
MDYSALLSIALRALLRNKIRSLLTVLGITIGIAAVICVVAIGNAGQKRVEQQLNNASVGQISRRIAPVSRINPYDQLAITRAPTMPASGSIHSQPNIFARVNPMIANTDTAASAITWM